MKSLNKENVINFFLAYILSAFGYEFIFFVMTIYVYEVTKSALNVGFFAALTFLPRLFAPICGVIIDRYRRELVFATSAAGVALLLVAMVFSSSLYWIYSVWLLVSVMLTIIMNVRTTLMTEIMSRDNFLLGNSLVLISLNCAKLLAPLLGGVVSTVFNVKSLFLCISGLYIIVLLSSGRIRLSGPSSLVEKNKKMLPGVVEGLKYIITNSNLRFLLAAAFLWRFFLGMQLSLYIVYIKSFLGGGDTEYGFFMTAVGIGSVIGSLAGPWVLKKAERPAVTLVGLTIHYGSFILLGLTHDYYCALLVAFCGYVAFYCALVGLHSLRDESTRSDIRGRVYGSVTAILTPATVISVLLGGYISGILGPEKTLLAAGAAALISYYTLCVVTRQGIKDKLQDRSTTLP